jgi:uncharacterized membrane protein HdeD (DUF308 family)
MSERAKLQREMAWASLLSTTLFILGAVAALRPPSGHETVGIVLSVACIVAGTWWVVKLQRLKKRLQAAP